ncbi:hypothetical protein RhiJN_13447 [Ceratobasidium sp. AG-Ba]|nr:hypothetical protein RhiJN_13447 [Ceratobasidium sp. AG-Ba]
MPSFGIGLSGAARIRAAREAAQRQALPSPAPSEAEWKVQGAVQSCFPDLVEVSRGAHIRLSGSPRAQGRVEHPKRPVLGLRGEPPQHPAEGPQGQPRREPSTRRLPLSVEACGGRRRRSRGTDGRGAGPGTAGGDPDEGPRGKKVEAGGRIGGWGGDCRIGHEGRVLPSLQTPKAP